MAKSYKPIDPSKLRTYSAHERAHRSEVARFAKLPEAGASARELLDAMPAFLGVESLRRAVAATVAARRAGRPVVWAMGAHVIKVGCAPIVIDLIRRDIVTGVVFNGAGAIHDVEVATLGATSEDVAANIRDGMFGMVRETASIFDEIEVAADRDETGLGAAVGRWLLEHRPANVRHSILAAAAEKSIPATVHVAIGTDTIHMLDRSDGAALGRASLRDFRIACSVVADMASEKGTAPGGVWYNIGSAVVLPEVFLKAVSVARNMGANLDAMVTVNMDMLRHYRPQMNVVRRPVVEGNGLDIAGHHEILLPLLRQALIESLGTE